MQRGGKLVLVGPAGLFDQYGKPDERLLKTAFGSPAWEKMEAKWAWSPREPAGAASETGVYRTNLGQGRVILFADLGREALMEEVAQGEGTLLRLGKR